ncbi:MAG: spore coat protein U domain-containing protein [Deltaproteobacteria bacterium]|nr:spore coat protein U domain-containing protein [Deltaproteobacteria bacterium]
MSNPVINRTKTIVAALGLAAAFLAGASAMAATCKISGGPWSLNFGTLDPALGNDITSLSGTVVLNCGAGLPYSVSLDNGLYFASGRRRLSNGAWFIPYAITTALPVTGVGAGVGGPASDIIIDLTGAINGVDYVNAVPGAYGDTLVLTILF